MKTRAILSNPEFQRNLWQKLTTHRIIGGVVILSLLAWLNYVANSTNSFYWISYGIIFIWGIKSASESIQEECQQGTWDYQRMSALSPFKFTWGKLLGSTSYTWYLAGICFIYFIALGRYFDTSFATLIHDYLILILCGLLGQYIAMVLSLNAIQFGRDKIYSFRYFIGALILSSILVIMLHNQMHERFDSKIQWYYLDINFYRFLMMLTFILLSWSILGAYRLIRTEFQYKNQPYIWLTFCLFWIVYATGFMSINLDEAILDTDALGLKDAVVYSKLYVAFFTASILLYLSLFSEKQSLVTYKKLLLSIQKKNFSQHLALIPRWVVAGILFLILTIGVIFFGDISITVNPPLLAKGYAVGLSMLLLATRDVLLVHFFYFSAHSKRAILSSMLYLVLLYLVLPSLFIGLGLKELNTMLLPSPKEIGLIGYSGLFLQVGLLAWLVKKRFFRV